MAQPLPQPAQPDYKIVPITQRTTDEKITNLKQYLAANIAVAREDNELAMAAQFQEHLDLVEVLVEHSRDRI